MQQHWQDRRNINITWTTQRRNPDKTQKRQHRHTTYKSQTQHSSSANLAEWLLDTADFSTFTKESFSFSSHFEGEGESVSAEF